MNIRRSIIGAVLAGASLVGVASMASSAAHAETPAATTTETEVGATAQSTRRFWIENVSSKMLTIVDAKSVASYEQAFGGKSRPVPPLARDALLPDDSVPLHARLAPGEHVTVEVVSQLLGHEILVTISDLQWGQVKVSLGVDFNTRYSDAWTQDFRVGVGGQNVTIYDK